jgi:type I restriction enzyme, S subunit
LGAGLHPGDLLIARSGATAGKSLLFRGLAEPAVFAGYLIRFKVRVDRVLPEYLAHFLQSPMYWGFIRKTARAVAQPNVNAREMASLPVPLPPLSEQQRIVDLLSRAESIVRMRREAEAEAKAIIPAQFLDMFGDPATNPKGWDVKCLAELATFASSRGYDCGYASPERPAKGLPNEKLRCANFVPISAPSVHPRPSLKDGLLLR